MRCPRCAVPFYPALTEHAVGIEPICRCMATAWTRRKAHAVEKTEGDLCRRAAASLRYPAVPCDAKTSAPWILACAQCWRVATRGILRTLHQVWAQMVRQHVSIACPERWESCETAEWMPSAKSARSPSAASGLTLAKSALQCLLRRLRNSGVPGIPRAASSQTRLRLAWYNPCGRYQTMLPGVSPLVWQPSVWVTPIPPQARNAGSR